jgi:RHS repeat-associated protein
LPHTRTEITETNIGPDNQPFGKKESNLFRAIERKDLQKVALLLAQGINANAAFRFHGQWLETSTDLYHMRARDYDPRTGRFLSRDPNGGSSEIPESFHPYSFSDCNPHIYSDPSGEFTVIEINIVGAIQYALHTSRAVAANRSRKFAIDLLQDALLNLATSPLSSLLPVNLGDAFQGFEFERKIREVICDGLGNPRGYFYFEVGIDTKGKPLGDGLNCSDIEENDHRVNVSQARKGIRNKPGTAYAEMIIGPRPPTDESTKAWAIAEVKRSTQTAYDAYIAGRKSYQFDNFARYADHAVAYVDVISELGKRRRR